MLRWNTRRPSQRSKWLVDILARKLDGAENATPHGEGDIQTLKM